MANKMRLSFSTNGFTRHSLPDALEAIASVGYRGVEILADRPHLFSSEVTAENLAQLNVTLAETGLSVSNINANTVCGYYGKTFWEPLFEPSLANPDLQARGWRLQYTKNSIDIARTVGATVVSVTSGRMIPGVMPDESLAILRDSIVEVIAYAEHAGVRVGIEYEPGLLIENCQELVAFLEDIDSPWLGANLDIGHSHVAGEDFTEVVASLGEKIFHVHLEDIKAEKHFHLIPGEGDLDFNEILLTLSRHSYAGYVTVELYSYPHRAEEAARQAWNFLAKFPYWQD